MSVPGFRDGGNRFVIRERDRQDVAVHVMIYVWNKLVSWPKTDPDANTLYFDYVVKRYQTFPNLIWDISKEATGYWRTTSRGGSNARARGWARSAGNRPRLRLLPQVPRDRGFHFRAELAVRDLAHHARDPGGPYHVFAGNCYRHMADFVEKHDLNRLEVSKGKANGGFCRSRNKDLLVHLIPRENDIIIHRPPRIGFTRMQMT